MRTTGIQNILILILRSIKIICLDGTKYDFDGVQIIPLLVSYEKSLLFQFSVFELASLNKFQSRTKFSLLFLMKFVLIKKSTLTETWPGDTTAVITKTHKIKDFNSLHKPFFYQHLEKRRGETTDYFLILKNNTLVLISGK